MSIKIITKNKKARFEFHLDERLEAGMILMGTEVKSIRLGKLNLDDSYVSVDSNNEVWLYNMHISPYEFGNRFNHEETRKRKLLLHKTEIVKLLHAIKAGGNTIVPTMLYYSNNKIKLEIALAKGKKLHDKRADEAKRDVERRLRRGDYD